MTDQTITEKIINALEQCGELRGVEYITFEIAGASSRTWVRTKLNALEADGEITIERHNGRGRKNIIRKNRNSPGSPRRTDKQRRQIP